jgi:hypothetical protein
MIISISFNSNERLRFEIDTFNDIYEVNVNIF